MPSNHQTEQKAGTQDKSIKETEICKNEKRQLMSYFAKKTKVSLIM